MYQGGHKPLKMIKIYYYPEDSVEKVLKKSNFDFPNIEKTVREILDDIKKRRDKALFEYTQKFDGLSLNQKTIKVTKEEIQAAYEKVQPEQLNAIKRAAENVYDYHVRYREKSVFGEDNGRQTGFLIRPLETVGIYVPGGTAAYPSSVLMCALPAKAVGVNRIIMCSPKIENPLTLVAAEECGVDEIYRVGGAQAIGAMAYGTDSIPKVDIIAGPGNIYVTMAKKLVFGEVKIDMIAGPSEILVIADRFSHPETVAADLLSQAEHDKLSRSILITDNALLAKQVKKEITKQTAALDRKDIVKASLTEGGAIIVTENIMEAVELSNQIAPEHLILMVRDYKKYLGYITNAGAVFAGYHSPESLGDYYAGPSHVLPTSGAAKYFEVLNTNTFTKKISFINYSKQELEKAAEDIITLADAEGLKAHANAVKVRLGEEK